VVVVVAVVVPESWAAAKAGTAQIDARTSIPLARALAPFIAQILRPATSWGDTEFSAGRIYPRALTPGGASEGAGSCSAAARFRWVRISLMIRSSLGSVEAST